MNTFPILFEDESMIVIDKPAGVVVNNAESAKGMTVQQWAEEYLSIAGFEVATQIQEEFVSRGGVVHRLDKETSGALIIAKTPEAFEKIKEQFKGRGVEKTYIALAHGKIETRQGEINMPVGRLPWNRTRFGVLAEGREAKTLYEVIDHRLFEEGKERQDLTLLKLFPKTGRTHQIRVHLRHLGYPIFGDSLYAGRKQGKRDRRYLDRHFLHASSLMFDHPKTGDRMVIESPMPAELEQFLGKTKVIRS